MNAHAVLTSAESDRVNQDSELLDPVVPPVISVVGKSGSGKTTLLEKLLLNSRNVACVRCGGTVAPRAALARIADALGDDPKALKQVMSVCLDCRGTTMVF